MAKRKHQFRPDRRHSGILNKLYIPRSQRVRMLRWFLFGIFFLVLLVIQNSVTSRYRLYGGFLDLAPAALILICVQQGSHPGSVFALAASMLCVFAGTAPNSFCILFLTAYACFACVFREEFLRRSFSSAWLCSAGALVLYELSVFLMGLFLGYTYPQRLSAFAMTTLYSVLIMPLLYPMIGKIGKIGGETWTE